MNANLRNFALWVIIVLLLLALFTVFQNPGQRSVTQDISFSQLLNDVDQGKVRDVVIQGPEIHGTYTDGRGFNTYAPNDPTLARILEYREQRKQQQNNNHPQGEIAQIGVHPTSLSVRSSGAFNEIPSDSPATRPAQCRCACPRCQAGTPRFGEYTAPFVNALPRLHPGCPLTSHRVSTP